MTGEQDGSIVLERISCSFSDLNLNQVLSLDAVQPDPEALRHGGWLWYNNLGVSNEAGNLLCQDGQPLKASTIRLFAADVSWRYGFNFTTSVKTPLGKQVPTDEGWRFPGLLRYGVVLFQPGSDRFGSAWQIGESSADQPLEFGLNPELNIYANINDAKGSYSDNSGSFDLYMQVIG